MRIHSPYITGSLFTPDIPPQPNSNHYHMFGIISYNL
jgi:hypothetical protein